MIIEIPDTPPFNNLCGCKKRFTPLENNTDANKRMKMRNVCLTTFFIQNSPQNKEYKSLQIIDLDYFSYSQKEKYRQTVDTFSTPHAVNDKDTPQRTDSDSTQHH
jgi:hypothetical protein